MHFFPHSSRKCKNWDREAKALRELDTLIQEANWTTELVEH